MRRPRLVPQSPPSTGGEGTADRRPLRRCCPCSHQPCQEPWPLLPRDHPARHPTGWSESKDGSSRPRGRGSSFSGGITLPGHEASPMHPDRWPHLLPMNRVIARSVPSQSRLLVRGTRQPAAPYSEAPMTIGRKRRHAQHPASQLHARFMIDLP